MLQNKKQIPQLVLRISMSLVFLYFGFAQISDPDSWTGFVPGFLTNTIITANNIVIFNGILELTLGIFLLIGLYIRFSSMILALHLFFIALSIGFNPLGIRDFGLAMASFAIFLNGPDYYSVDKVIERNKLKKGKN